jgi:hypothetical protein
VHIPKAVRNTTYAVAIIIFIFIAGGLIYVYITDRTTKFLPITESQNNVESSSLPKPTQPGPNDPEGVAVESVTSPVNAGSNASASALTNAGSKCTIIVSYNGIQSNDSGLTSKVANPYGSVTWAWTVGNSVPIGTWPIKITCIFNGRSGVADTSLQVVK